MRKKICIFGHYGVPNWGDEAILSGILSQIDISKFSITVISNDTEFIKKQHNIKSVSPPPFGVRSFFSFNWIQTLKAIKEADYIIIGGGGLWQPRPLKAIKLWNFYLQTCLFFKKSNAKIFSLGTSFSVFSEQSAEYNTHEYKKLIKKTAQLLQKIKFFTVRDKQSKTVLTDIYNIHEAKISITTDAAFFLEPEKTNITKEKIVLFAMREGDITFEQEKIIITALKKQFKKYTFKFLVMQSHQSHDEKFVERHKKLFKKITIIYPKSTKALLAEISSATFVCSSRLHANILASICNTNFLAISCRDKVKNFFSEILYENILESKNIKNNKKYITDIHIKISNITKNNNKNFNSCNTKFLEIQKKKLQNF
ncbi:TPA: polysaccharide pyruvyl transferase family protein, partial [Candidatus Gracilibacteria bacterium]|nr:polysaccharide pyruvyl transferase family protein [Candidatus Gracilibacteria bacterium]HIQ57092.1 polysaccharide pyruvyl transferase family protein [Candidatus Gracilibacteria bacterium]